MIRTNGIRTNGVRTNGVRTNGIRTNRIRTNAIWTNGMTPVESGPIPGAHHCYDDDVNIDALGGRLLKGTGGKWFKNTCKIHKRLGKIALE